MRRILSTGVLALALVFGGCHIQLTPSLIAALLTTLQSEITQLPAGEVPSTVTAALALAVQAASGDASGSSWATIARQALTTVYSDLPAADQGNPWINGTILGLEAALEAVGS